jgi:hypothetical protein
MLFVPKTITIMDRSLLECGVSGFISTRTVNFNVCDLFVELGPEGWSVGQGVRILVIRL